MPTAYPALQQPSVRLVPPTTLFQRVKYHAWLLARTPTASLVPLAPVSAHNARQDTKSPLSTTAVLTSAQSPTASPAPPPRPAKLAAHFMHSVVTKKVVRPTAAIPTAFIAAARPHARPVQLDIGHQVESVWHSARSVTASFAALPLHVKLVTVDLCSQQTVKVALTIVVS